MWKFQVLDLHVGSRLNEDHVALLTSVPIPQEYSIADQSGMWTQAKYIMGSNISPTTFYYLARYLHSAVPLLFMLASLKTSKPPIQQGGGSGVGSLSPLQTFSFLVG